MALGDGHSFVVIAIGTMNPTLALKSHNSVRLSLVRGLVLALPWAWRSLVRLSRVVWTCLADNTTLADGDTLTKNHELELTPQDQRRS